MVIDFAVLEQAIVNRLKDAPNLPSEARILAYPDRPSEIGSPVGKCAIVVRFNRLDLTVNQSTNRHAGFVQEGTATIEIRLITKDLRSHTGSYQLLSIIFDRLIGWTPQLIDPKPLAPLSLNTSELAGFGEGIWDWASTFSLPVILMTRREYEL